MITSIPFCLLPVRSQETFHYLFVRTLVVITVKKNLIHNHAEGVDLSENDLEEWVAVIDTLNPDGEPSMRQDCKAGRRTEVALFAGTVCELGRKHGIATPVNDVFRSHFRISPKSVFAPAHNNDHIHTLLSAPCVK